MFKLNNKTSIVTGASKGIGKSIAVNLAKNPAYSHIITNMNVIIVLLLAFFLFNSPLNYQSCLGIFLCILGIGLILMNS